MIRASMPLALSETNSFMWAADATPHQPAHCPRCFEPVQLDSGLGMFAHPDSVHCSSVLGNQKSALLYLERLLNGRRGLDLMILLRCSICGCETDTFSLMRDFVACKIVAESDGSQGLFVDCSTRVLILMRPASAMLRNTCYAWGAYWLEFDARNILSGQPLQALGGNVWHCCSNCLRAVSLSNRGTCDGVPPVIEAPPVV